jgi:hypothetical protein
MRSEDNFLSLISRVCFLRSLHLFAQIKGFAFGELSLFLSLPVADVENQVRCRVSRKKQATGTTLGARCLRQKASLSHQQKKCAYRESCAESRAPYISSLRLRRRTEGARRSKAHTKCCMEYPRQHSSHFLKFI